MIRLRPAPTLPRGFALVVTLSLMILLTVLAVGLLSLSAISLRQSGADADGAMARANARLALMLALGELQKSAGPDTRVTATADAIAGGTATVAQALTGAWRSWENSDLDASRLPLVPDYAQKKATFTSAMPTGRFLGWLASTPATATPDAGSPPSLAKGVGTVPLLSTGTLGPAPDPATEVHLVPVKIAAAKRPGSFAWWIGGENSKANLALKQPTPASAVESRDLMAAHGRPDEQAFAIQFIATGIDGKLASRSTLDLAATMPKPANRNFHNLTTWSRGLLTNTAGGGWRKDLSLLSEYGLAQSDGAPAADALVYPFASLNPGTSSPPPNYEVFGAVVRWPAVLDYMTQYKQSTAASAGGIADFTTIVGDIGSKFLEDYVDKNMRTLVIADIRNVLGYSALKVSSNPDVYQAAVSMNPVVTLWNPWNYQIRVDGLKLNTASLPLAFNLRISDGATATPWTEVFFRDLVNAPNTTTERTKLRLNLNNATGGTSLLLGPGETMVLSPDSPLLVDVTPDINKTAQIQLELRPGYRTYGGYRFKIPKPSSAVPAPPVAYFTGSGNATIEISSITPQANVGYSSTTANTLIGMYVDTMAIVNGANRNYGAKRFFFNTTDAAKWFKPLTGLPSARLADAAASNAVFASTILHCRTANDTQVPGRVAYQSNPLTLYEESGRATADRIGCEHPVNTPFEFAIRAHSGWNDSLLPNSQGCVVTGIAGNNGLSRCILAEVPLRPVQSLAELQHFQVRGPNRAPPYRTNILGNSAAYPLLKSDAVNLTKSGATAKMQWDDSYVMNRLFFDDWFVSSIAPETSDWSGQTKRSLATVYADHLAGTRPLPNSQYAAAPRAAADDLSARTRHLTIASRLEVAGMFNVNSTSAEAWRALLAHARDLAVPVLGTSGVTLATDKGHAVSRTTTAGDFSADNALSSYQKFGGHRRLTDNQIEALAKEIVKQIRRRGPALGLSEFVNRQLRGAVDQDLALAGPIQAALDALAGQAGSTNPFTDLQALCQPITSANVPTDASYSFAKAAEGWTGEGLPGWISQADLLRPLAPILSARDDTFVIRTCGTALAEDGKTIRAQVWCEAVVQRQAEFTTPDAGTQPADDANLEGANKDINRRFGRRFNIVSMRYLSPTEI